MEKLERVDKRLADAVAGLLSQEGTTHPEFMWEVNQALEKRGYVISAHQRGIGGTHLLVRKLVEKQP